MSRNKYFSILIKPTSADCNLRCQYCFYLDHIALYSEEKQYRMSDKILEHLISSYMKMDLESYSFNWQGGEPTLMGLSFFKKVIHLQQKYGKGGKRVVNSLQTNATLINDEFAVFLANYHFLVGVSIDGPEEMHDKYRVNKQGAGSHKKVIEGIQHLIKNKVDFNFLVLISDANIEKPQEVYRYLKSLNATNFFQFIPCVEFDEKGNKLPFSITGKQWGKFLTEIFLEWRINDKNKISIRNFDTIINKMVLNNPNSCIIGNNCCQYFVVEYNGDIYPCDFFVQERYKLGNIKDKGWPFFLKSDKYKKFGQNKGSYNKECTECDFIHYCYGDCLKHRYYGHADPRQLSFLCEGIKIFYQNTLKDFKEMSNQLKMRMS